MILAVMASFEHFIKIHTVSFSYFNSCYIDTQCKLSILKRFDFSSELRRMSVIAKNELSGNLSCFTKGSPEIIAELSNPDTVPDNFNQILEKYTKYGYRVLGFSYKDISQSDMVQEIKRETLECDLEFLGLILMKNKAKTESAP